MKIQIDTEAKTILIMESVSLKELQDLLSKLFSKKELEGYTIGQMTTIPTTIIIQHIQPEVIIDPWKRSTPWQFEKPYTITC